MGLLFTPYAYSNSQEDETWTQWINRTILSVKNGPAVHQVRKVFDAR